MSLSPLPLDLRAQVLTDLGYSLQDCTAVVAGCDGQIGTELCKRLAEHGCDVIGTSISESGLAATESALAGRWGHWLGGSVCDFTNAESFDPALERMDAL